MAPKFVVQTEIETGRRLAQASPQLLHCEHCSEDDEDDDYDQIVDEVAEHEDNGDRGDDQDGHGDMYIMMKCLSVCNEKSSLPIRPS